MNYIKRLKRSNQFKWFKKKRCKNCKYFKDNDPIDGRIFCTEWGYRNLKLDFILDRVRLFCFRKKKK